MISSITRANAVPVVLAILFPAIALADDDRSQRPVEAKPPLPKASGPIVSPPVEAKVSPPLRRLIGAGPRPTSGDDRPERRVLDAYLAKLKAAGRAQVLDVESADLKRVFPKHSFFVARFRQYPVAIMPPPPLAANNVFAVSGTDVIHLKSAADLESFFKSTLAPVADAETAVSVGNAWLRLSQEFHQDGFLDFKPPESTAQLSEDGVTAKGTARVVEKLGDKGEVTVVMTFKGGKLVTATQGGKIYPGIRPRCQANLLLDPNPVVRAIARRDLVVMGSKAKQYLREQRAKVSPELQREIDDVWRQIVEEGR